MHEYDAHRVEEVRVCVVFNYTEQWCFGELMRT